MDRILIILKKENRSRASSALTLGLNTIILKHVYWCHDKKMYFCCLWGLDNLFDFLNV